MNSLVETGMGRKKKADSHESPTKAVKLDRMILFKAQMIAADRGNSLSDYLSGLLKDPVERDWSNLVQRLDDRIQSEN